MDDAVGGVDVGGDHARLVDTDRLAVDSDRDVLTLCRGRTLQLHDVRGHDLTRNHVVEQHLAQGLGVGEQRVECPLGESGECLIGGGEHRVRPFTLKRLDQPGRLDCGEQGGEVARLGGDSDDVGLLRRHRSGGCGRGDGGGRRRVGGLRGGATGRDHAGEQGPEEYLSRSHLLRSFRLSEAGIHLVLNKIVVKMPERDGTHHGSSSVIR